MRKSLVSLLACIAVLFLTLTANAQVDVSGALVGNGSYTTLGAAFTAINGGAQTSAVITIGISGNTSEGSATATLNAGVWTSITISPTGGASRTITGATTAGSPMIDFSGADNVTIDGLNTGGNSLTISNTTASATSVTSTIRFIGGATNNTITNCSLQGSGNASVATNGAVVFFSTDAVTANGNDNNTISNCDIGPAGVNLPTKCILGNGSTTTTAIGNSGIVISNNTIHDYFSATVTSAGVATNGGCNNWTVTGNKFYQGATRTWTTGAVHNAILMGPSTATSGMQGAIITNNIIGYATNSQTGTYTLTGSTGIFRAIHLTAITSGTLNRISNNTIAAISLTGVTSSGTSTSTPFACILANTGLTNTDSNTIGSQSATGSIVYSTNTTTATDVYGFYNFGSNDWNCRNNTIGGFTANNAGASGAFIFYGIRCNTGAALVFTASNNLIGGTVANSISSNSTSTTAQMIGMQIATGNGNLSTNTIRNITAAGGTGTGTGASVMGIATNAATSSNHTLTSNLIHTLSNTSAAGAVTVTGIMYGSTTGTNTIERNFIHSFSIVSSSASATMNGISVNSGTSTYKNNMIRLGIDAAGSSITAGIVINGINEQVAGTDNFYNNSVYIGGSGVVTTAANTYAFISTITTNTRNFKDNIFWNARSNGTSTGKHYGIRVGGTAANPTGLASDYNLVYVNGTGGVFGFFNSLDVANLSAWKVATGQDGSSIEGYDPQFLTPAGTSSTVDLHISPTNPTVIEGSGIAVAGVTDDFDGQTRSTLTPTDMGADAGNFVAQDVSGPAISYTPLTNTIVGANQTLTATITDASGVGSGAGLPTLYYKLNAGAYSAVTGTDIGSNQYTFTFGSVTSAPGDVISYYLVAQDAAGSPNFSCSPSLGASGFTANPPAVSTPPTTPNTFTAVGSISGTKTVGSAGRDYATLKAAFDDINTKVLTANLILDIQAEGTTETATAVLNTVSNYGGSFTLTIKPNSTATVTGSIPSAALIKLNGSDNVIIDGSNSGGTDKSLTISNTNTTSPTVISLVSLGTGQGATNNTIKNCIMSTGASTATGYGIAVGGNTPGTSGADNDNVTIQNNTITVATVSIYVAGTASVTSGGDDNLNITGNNLNSNTTIQTQAIQVGNALTSSISLNTISVTTSGAFQPVGISLETGFVSSTVTRNLITNILATNTGGYGGRGITVGTGTASSSLTIANNVIYGVNGSNWNAFSNSSSAGIWIGTVGGSTTISTTAGGVSLYYNSVSMTGSMGSGSTTAITAALYVGSGASALDIRNNVLANTQTGTSTTQKNYAIYSAAANTAFTNINYNDYYVANTFNAASAIPGFLGSDRTNLAGIQTGFGGNANSLVVDPTFSNATNDLRILAGSPVYHVGTPVSVTTDYTGATRDASTPTLGAYEATLNGGPVITYTALTGTSNLNSRSLNSVSITDGDGVAGGGNAPRVYWKVNAAAFSLANSAAGVYNGSTYDFTIGTSGLSVADVVSYFVVAQDNLGAVNSNPATGLVATDVNTITTYPTSPNTYTIAAPPLSGTYTVGTTLFRPIGGGKLEFETRTRQVQRRVLADNDAAKVDTKSNPNSEALNKLPEYKESDYVFTTVEETYQVPMVNGVEYKGTLYHEFTKEEKLQLGLPDAMVGDFATLASAVSAFNSRGVNGATVFSLTDASYAEGNIVLNNVSDAPTTAVNTLKIRPAAGVSVSISSSQASLPIIKSIGLNYFTIDGNPFGAEALTITNSSATAPIGIHIASSGTTTITQDTVKNVTVVGGLNSGTTTTAIGITISDQAAGGFGNGYGNGIVVTNCTFQKSMFGVLSVGGSAAGTNNMTNISFTNNNLATSGANCIGFCGIGMQGTNGGLISQNTIANFETVSALDHRGIWLPTAAKNIVVERNNINTLGYTGTSGYGNYGVLLTTGETASNNIVRNNVIADLWGDGWTHLTVLGDNTHGVYATGTQTGIKIYNNSISLGRNTLNQTDALTTGICLATGSTADIRNNSIVNNAGLSAATGYGSTCIYLQSAASQLENSNYNNLYDNATGSGVKLAGKIATTNYTTLALYKAATSLDSYSLSGDPAYTSSTNLLPDVNNANCWLLSGNGLPGLVTNDYNGTARSVTVAGGAVDIGAYEFVPVAAAPSVAGSPAAPPVGGGTQTFTSNGKLLAQIDWGATGTNPSAITFTFYPGTNPPGSTGFNVGNGYWVITVPDGTGFTYDLTLYYDPAQLGTIPADTNVVICKSEDGGGVYAPFLVYGTNPGEYERNSAQHKIIIHGLSSFSTFGLGDNNAPLPVELASFTANIDRRNVNLNWSTVSELNNAGFDIERKISTSQTWTKVGNVAGNGTSATTHSYSFIDRNIESGKYNYRLKQIDNNGNFNYHQLSSLVDVGIPTKFDISQNYPNPFNPTTKINYDLPFDSKVSIMLYDMTGRQVATIINATQSAGYHTVQFNASNLASGTYFYNIIAEGGNASKFITTKKMVLVK
ncbi:MAG: T9SS type A sorting domain-containing protein [Bacteroidetes bacterium]|nr:T9SS type A sorting domain-containing protein [Bacteroidota bacterium]